VAKKRCDIGQIGGAGIRIIRDPDPNRLDVRSESQSPAIPTDKASDPNRERDKTKSDMSDDPKTPTRDQRKAAITSWLSSIPPAHPTKPTLVDRVAPWRLELAEAVAAGYSWTQLAKHVANRPEIGVNVTGDYLKQCVHQAFIQAKETPPAATRTARRAKKKSAAKPVAAAVAP
jgi:hypothetical protein